jgi:hypothetical protein
MLDSHLPYVARMSGRQADHGLHGKTQDNPTLIPAGNWYSSQALKCHRLMMSVSCSSPTAAGGFPAWSSKVRDRHASWNSCPLYSSLPQQRLEMLHLLISWRPCVILGAMAIDG